MIVGESHQRLAQMYEIVFESAGDGARVVERVV